MKKILFTLVLLITQNLVFSQEQVANLIKAGKDDGAELFEAYVKPFGTSLGYSMNNGWYNTANAHRIVGFDINASFSMVMIPKAEKTFDFSELNMKSLKLLNPNGTAESSTLFGKASDGPMVFALSNVKNPVTNQFDTISKFKLPKGLNVPLIANPMLQLRIGTVKNTDIIVRYFPEVNLADRGNIKFWGVGVLHDVKQWIPGIKHLPFSLAFVGGYSKLDMNYDFGKDHLTPETGSYYENGTPTKTDDIRYDNQKMIFNVTAYNLNLVVSKSFLGITPYLGVGYSHVKSIMKLEGIYPVTTHFGTTGAMTGRKIVEDFTDPIEVSPESSSAKVTAGLRLKFLVFTFHADATYAKYASFNAGIGLSVR